METGCSASFLTINGNFISDQGSTLVIFLEPEASSGLNVSADVTLGSNLTLQIDLQAGCYTRSGETYEFLLSDSLSGTFSQVNIASRMLTHRASYTSERAFVTIIPVALTRIATSGNANSVLNAIDTFIDDGDASLFTLIGNFIPYTLRQVISSLINTGNPFTVTGYFPDRSLVSPGVSITGNMMQDLLTVGLYYNGEFKGNYSDHSYGGQARLGF